MIFNFLKNFKEKGGGGQSAGRGAFYAFLKGKKIGVCVFFIFSFMACTSSKEFRTGELLIENADGKQSVLTVEIAETEAERQRGLMFRKTLPDGQGMIFLFEKDQILSFWMKNTLIPLSIAFIASDGRILEIRDMEPKSLSVIRSSRSGRYALEVPQGWFARVGIGAGDRVILENFF